MSSPVIPRHRRSEAGYNLIETLIAVAILGTVLMSIVTLFYFGRANVYSGKQMTAAVSVGTRVLEDLSILSLDDTVSLLGASGATLSDFSYAGQSFDDSVKITTSPMPSTPPAMLTNWRNLMPASRFLRGKVTVVLSPMNAATNAPAASLAAANVLKVRIFVEWNEARRARRVVLDTVKVQRGR